MDYRNYRCNKKDLGFCAALSTGIGGLIAQLFYRSWYALVLAFPVFWLIRRFYADRRLKKRKDRLLAEFREAMQAVSTALLAGYSMENAWSEAEKELTALYDTGTEMVRELHQMNVKIRMNQPLEQVLAEFAERSDCEDIESFSEVFSFAKRSGGDFAGIIRTTVERLNAKLEVEREIDTVIAGKRLEARIMSIMPIFLMIYLNLSSGDFLSPLYGNPLGVCVMTVVLVIYAGAMRWSEKIVRIEV